MAMNPHKANRKYEQWLLKRENKMADKPTRQELQARLLTVPIFDSEYEIPIESDMIDVDTAHYEHCTCAPCQRCDYFDAQDLYEMERWQRQAREWDRILAEALAQNRWRAVRVTCDGVHEL
jgi:hypothetical protein